MTSALTQVPYDYYALAFCEPEKKEYVPENLGKYLVIFRLFYGCQYLPNINLSVLKWE